MRVFLVYETDGYTKGRLLAGFTEKEDADLMVQKCGNYAMIDEIRCDVYKSWDEFLEYSPQSKKERALAKLTAEERKLLGY